MTWKNNAIQFPRLIAEAEAAGAFTDQVLADMATSMDLSVGEIAELLGRASDEWDEIKKRTFNGTYHPRRKK